VTITVADAKRLLGDRANQAFRGLALEATGRIVKRTPVDTGRARGNWNIGLGQPDRTLTETVDKSGEATVARGAAMIHQAGLDRTLYITNSVPYIVPLEHGHSRQAPAGMVAVTVAELQPLAQQIAAKIRAGSL